MSTTTNTTLASSGTDVVPVEFVCPISRDAMTDPVVAPDGNTYERAAIETWLREHGTSPLTREPMPATALVPNRNLRDAIANYNQQQQQPLSADRQRAAAPAAQAPAAPCAAAATLSVSEAKLDAGGIERRDCLLTVTPPAGDPAARAPANLVLVIDTSRSMSKEATAVDADGHSEDTGLCVLDIVKHAALTICEMLGAQDHIAVVDFSTSARPGPLVAADAAGKAAVKATLDGMVPNGSTNLWAGIQAAVEIANQPSLKASHSNTSIFVLTDGLPTVTPPSGYPRSLERYLPSVCVGPCPFTISTFGFGYRLDSAMLAGVASVGRGSFSFIPDAGLVGTVFVNAVAALLTTLSPVTRVKVTLPKNTRIEPKAAHLDAVATVQTAVNRDGGTTVTIDMGATQFGQPRHIAFTVGPVAAPMDDSSPSPASRCPLSAALFLGTGKHGSGTIDVTIEPATTDAAWTEHAVRQAFVAAVPELDLSERATSSIDRLRADLVTAGATNGRSSMAAALLKDLEGEVSLGISTEEHFGRWAPHYFRSIAAANRCQTCNNFKDHSVQLYGGELFKSIQSAGELSFLGIPAPEPTQLNLTPAWQLAAQQQQQHQQPLGSRAEARRHRQCADPTADAHAARARAANAAASATPAPTDVAALPTRTAPRRAMNWAYDRGGGCFAPGCEVTLAGGRRCPAEAVKAGDTLHDGRSIVECVVRVRIDRDVCRLVRLKSGLIISRFHPIQLTRGGGGDGTWTFPADAPAALVANPSVAPDFDHLYSFVLQRTSATDDADRDAAVMVGGQLVAPFAHTCKADEGGGLNGSNMGALPHAFFGDRGAVIAALKAADGGAAYAKGAVEVAGFHRDERTHRITGITVASV